MKIKTLLSVAAAAAFACTGHATIVNSGYWQLGEAGTVNTAANPFATDSVAGHNITTKQAGATLSVVSTGLSAPGSTGALQIVNSGATSGIFGNSSGFNLSDDWSIQLWVRPDESLASRVLMQTDNSANGVSVLADAGTFKFAGGAGGIANKTTQSVAFTTGSWHKIDIIRFNGTNNYYVDNNLLATGTTQGSLLNAPMLAFGQGGLNGTDAAFDAMKTWGFDHTTDSLAGVEAAMGITAVPEPSTYGLIGAGALAAVAFVRRRRAAKA